jgi:thiol-disulfide isomerase/thioredoxin
MTISFRRWMLAPVLFALLAGSAFGQWKAGDRLPALAPFGLTGTLPASLAGKVVLLDFWASWCGPCKASFPVLDGLQKKYGARGFSVLAINVEETPAKMERFLAEHPISFPVLQDSKQKLVAAASVEAMPSSFLIDRSGVIRFAHVGFKIESTPAELDQEIERLLGAEVKP